MRDGRVFDVGIIKLCSRSDIYCQTGQDLRVVQDVDESR